MSEPKPNKYRDAQLPVPEAYRRIAEERAAREKANPRPPNFFSDLWKNRAARANQTGRDADPRRVLPLNGYKWQRLRAMVLAGEPLCRHCAAQGLTVAATDVDHINGDPSDNSMGNLASLCHACHSRKTAADHGKRIKTGHDVDGLPLSGPWSVKP